MTINPKPDQAIDKVLAALRDAAPAEGMNARITAHLEQHAQQAQIQPTSHWRTLLTGQSLTAAWFRGAATGAAFVLLAVAGILIFHRAPLPQLRQAASNTPAAHVTPVSESRAASPCPAPAVIRVQRATQAGAHSTLLAQARVDATAPSHPAPPLPLTPQELALVRIASTADPQQLATINPETEARLQAQQAAEFDKFFAPHPTPPAAESHE